MLLINISIPAVAIGMGLSTVSMLICTLIFPAAPRVTWEPYFEGEISEETKEVVNLAMRNV